jgi:peptidase M48-like protein
VSAGAQYIPGYLYLKYPREYERQADILGAQIMARAGYDPRDMANMFRTIEKTSGNGGPEWLSDHPNPANRYKYIEQEAQLLRVTNAIRDTRNFDQVKSRLRQMPQAPTMEEIARGQKGGRTTQSRYPTDRPIGRVDPPSTRVQSYDESGLFRVSVPSNWRELPGNNSVTFAPDGGYGNYQGQSVFTHGMEFGLDRTENHDLRTSTDELINGLSQGNPRLRRNGNYTSTTIAGRRALATTLTNVSDATGQPERIVVYTTQLADGSLFYGIGVAPSDEFGNYQQVFTRVMRSVQLNDNNTRSSRY